MLLPMPVTARSRRICLALVLLLTTSLPATAQAQAFTGATRVAAGGQHSCAINAAGGVECWGANFLGQLGDGTQTDRTAAVPVSGLASGVVAIGTGANHSCALLANGTVRCWGMNSSGELGDGVAGGFEPTPVAVIGLTGVSAIAVGDRHSCALTGTTLQCWGANLFGQLGNGGSSTEPAPVKVGFLTSVTAVTAGAGHTCAIEAGGVQCWGLNDEGQLGDDSTDPRSFPTEVVGLTSGVAAVAAGGSHSCARLNSGAVRCWGLNDMGQLGDGTTTRRLTSVAVSNLSGAVALDLGSTHSCATVTGGALRCWGRNVEGQLGDGSTGIERTPVAVNGLTGVTAFALGNDHGCAIAGGGAVQCWGLNSRGQIGNGRGSNNRLLPVVASVLAGANPTRLAPGLGHTCALSGTGAVQCWGANEHGQLGDGSNENNPAAAPLTGLGSGALAVSANLFHSCAVAAGGAARCWGRNDFGRLGTGNTTSQSTPTAVSGLGSGVSAISTGENHSCAVVNGGARCWGRNLYGQLGDGSTVDRLTPVATVGLASGVSDIVIGGSTSCARLGNGGVRCWGDNGLNQLGDGTQDNSSVPVTPLGLDSGVARLAVGGLHACALLSGGGVRCWGNNLSGQLGDGTTVAGSTPGPVLGLIDSGAVRIATGFAHSCALLTSGTVSCWGDNSAGQLGDGTTTRRLSPVAVAGLSGVVEIAAGYDVSCALLGSGSVRCWGANRYGQLGDGTLGYVNRPTASQRIDPNQLLRDGFEAAP